jgi:hypothetical protein
MALPQPAVILSLSCFNNVLRKKFPTQLEVDPKRWPELCNESRAGRNLYLFGRRVDLSISAPARSGATLYLIHFQIRHEMRVEP